MIQGLLLAAGNSRRFGSNKLYHKLSNDQPLVIASALKLQSVVDSISVVVQQGDEKLAELLAKQNIETVQCPKNYLGMGHSIACGVTKSKQATGWIIALADMPFIDIQTYKQVTNALENGALIATPTCAGRRGHPVGFSNRLYPDLTSLSGDIGARALLKKYESQIVDIKTNDRGIHKDIDTPDELNNLSAEYFSGSD